MWCNHILRRGVPILAVTLFLAACGTVPQPFLGTSKVTTDNPLLDVPTAVGVAVMTVDGLPGTLGERVAQAAADQFQTLEIPAEAVTSWGRLGFTLSGKAGAPVTVAGSTQVEIAWLLTSRRGAVAARFTQKLDLSAAEWQAATDTAQAAAPADPAPRIGRAAARTVATAIGAANQNDEPTLPTTQVTTAPPIPEASKPTYPTVSIQPVEGAPGDGREALRLAVLLALSDNGVRRDDVNPTVILECHLEITVYDAATQRVAIIWRAVMRDGHEVGTVKLENTIPVGALDGKWGPTAFSIAAAALKDLLSLLAQTPAK